MSTEDTPERAEAETPSASRRWLADRAELFYPFTDWIGELRNPEILRADLIAGVSIALVLVPQSMAYAQLAGLPPWIGLYAAFLSPIIAALFGSSRQLQNGPVAIISLMTAAALVPMQLEPAAYIAMAAALALMVGVFQMVLGAVEWTRLSELIVPAMIIALLSFVEAFSVAKAIASKTRQRLSADQEMIGKGLANVVAGVFQGYAVSGSFSRTAVAFDAGARTGMTSIISGLIVGITLLFLTPLLYHLPLSTLAAVIIVAVAGLVKFEPFKHAWAVNPHDGWVALVVFVTTLATAPHLETGIFVGVILSLLLYLYRTMKPHFAEVARDDDGVFRDAALYKLNTSDSMALYRYDGDLYFANAGYLEKRLLDAVADKPELRVLILDIEAVDQIDATGEDMLARISENFDAANIAFYLTRPKFKVLDALKRSGLYHRIGENRIFAKRKSAIVAIQKRYGDGVDVSHLITYQPLEDASEDDVPPKPVN